MNRFCHAIKYVDNFQFSSKIIKIRAGRLLDLIWIFLVKIMVGNKIQNVRKLPEPSGKIHFTLKEENYSYN